MTWLLAARARSVTQTPTDWQRCLRVCGLPFCSATVTGNSEWTKTAILGRHVGRKRPLDQAQFAQAWVFGDGTFPAVKPDV